MASKSSGKRKGTATQTPRPLKVTKRIVNVKRHTVGYVIDGKSYNLTRMSDRRTVLSMARNGRISGVRAVGNHIQAMPGRRKLSSLPKSIMRP